MNDTSIITIGITAYNCSDYLMEAIESVLMQSSNAWNGILILDGDSDRKTRKLFKNFQHPNFIKYSFNENKGPYGTRMKAIELANTDWYMQLDGDDLLPLNAVEYIISAIVEHPNAEFIFGNCEYFSKNKKIVKYPSENIENLSLGPLFNAVSPIKIAMYKKIGGFSKDLYINADWDFWLRVFEKHIVGHYEDKLFYKRRYREKNIGSNYIHLRPKIIKEIIKRHPIFFNNKLRKNNAKFNVYEKMARYYKSVGNRYYAAKYAKKALNYTSDPNKFEAIFTELKMSPLRYLLRRLGRIFN